jgi:hypothetical protein
MQRRLHALETEVERVDHTLFGNGDVGMDERLRHVESQQERYETARREDKDEMQAAISRVYERIGRMDHRFERMEQNDADIKRRLDESAGGWKIVGMFAKYGIPLIIGLLGWIGTQLMRMGAS